MKTPNRIVVSSTPDREVVVQKSTDGHGYTTIIRDKATGVERLGSQCPGDPSNFRYDPKADAWSPKVGR